MLVFLPIRIVLLGARHSTRASVSTPHLAAEEMRLRALAPGQKVDSKGALSEARKLAPASTMPASQSHGNRPP